MDACATVFHDDDAVVAPICARVAALAGVDADVVAEQWWLRFGAAAGGGALGIRTVCVDRRGSGPPDGVAPSATVVHLGELLTLLRA